MGLLKLSFAEPSHGWLPVRLDIGTSNVEFVASDVPNNPIEELIDALHSALGGREASVWWHLEPAGYYFEFQPFGRDVQLRILFAQGSDRSRATETASIRGTKQEILVPLWRGLRQLQSLSAVEPHWPEVRYGGMEELGERLRAGGG